LTARSLPPKGRIGIFAGSWYSDPIRQRILNEVSLKELDAQADQINRFEAMLVNEGALVLKFWFHLTKEGQVKRLKALEKDPRTAWRVTQWNWDRLKTYDKLQDVAGHILRLTNTPWAPWVVVEGTDDRYRSLTVGQIMLQAMQKKLASTDKQESPVAPMVRVDTDGRTVLSELNLGKKLDDKTYEKELSKWQARLAELMRDPRFKGRSLLCAFEGADAAGKGGAIRRGRRQTPVPVIRSPPNRGGASLAWRVAGKVRFLTAPGTKGTGRTGGRFCADWLCPAEITT
jgi:polyphosphate kinase 2 (PPK2 family)